MEGSSYSLFKSACRRSQNVFGYKKGKKGKKICTRKSGRCDERVVSQKS
jgi:hypothetical protein